MRARWVTVAEIEARMVCGVHTRRDQDTLLALLKNDDGGPVHAETAAPWRLPLAVPPPGAKKPPYMERSSASHALVPRVEAGDR